ncbi:hypothetical protein EYR38_002007 [Pleurotus pulmonarius]|nr:hypothetical protein EYR38_002007 [Pleurotus pulmonarius]
MSLFEQLRLVSDLEPITLRHIFNFTRITNKLKDDILLAQPASHFGDEPPVVLPPSIVLFMSQALDLPGTVISRLWDVLRLEAWEHQMPDDAKIFEEYGHRLGLSE